MGLEHVKESILAEGRTAAQAEVQRAQEEAKQVRARAEQRAAEVRAQRQAEQAAAVQALRRRELALAELEAKKLRLAAQKELLQRVRAHALERLGKQPAAQHEQYLTALVKRSGLTDARAWARAEDKGLIEKLGLQYAGPLEGVGGIVLETKDGAQREDLRYEDLLDDAWRDALGEVAGSLFSPAQAPAKGR